MSSSESGDLVKRKAYEVLGITRYYEEENPKSPHLVHDIREALREFKEELEDSDDGVDIDD